MERVNDTIIEVAASEWLAFLIKSVIFLTLCGSALFIALASSYPAVHDSLHNVRHALAVVPCH